MTDPATALVTVTKAVPSEATVHTACSLDPVPVTVQLLPENTTLPLSVLLCVKVTVPVGDMPPEIVAVQVPVVEAPF